MEPSRKRRAPSVAGRVAPSWLIARAAKYRQKFPLKDFYDVPYERGTPESLASIGASWRTATPQQRATRRAIMMTGRGLYRGRGGFFGGLAGLLTGQGWKKGSDIGDKLWESGGSALASYIPGLSQAVKIGDMVAPVGQALSTMTGKGLYKGRGLYAANNKVYDNGAVASNIVPQFHPSDLHTITYSNREYVRDIFAPPANTVFSLQSWELNPGLPTSFPWLSQLAINFEEYELVQLAYTFKSTIADFAANSGQVGQVLMCTQYNPDSSPFATKDEMMLYEGGMSCKTTESLIHGVECDPSKVTGNVKKFVRVGKIPPTEDMKNYDLGRTSLAVVNAPTSYAGQQIGELWVSYTVVLRNPKIASGNAYNVRRDVFIAPPKNIPASATDVRIADPSTFLACARNSLGCDIALPATLSNVATGANTDNLTEELVTQNSAVIPLQFTLTIPDSFSGILKVRLYTFSDTASPTNAIVAVSLAPATITRFKDMPQQVPASSNREWSHKLNTFYDAEVGASYNQDCELHLRIHTPFNGVPNVIQFGTALSSAYTRNLSYNIEIVQYNSFLSVEDNGRNDRLDLIQAFSGQPALYL